MPLTRKQMAAIMAREKFRERQRKKYGIMKLTDSQLKEIAPNAKSEEDLIKAIKQRRRDEEFEAQRFGTFGTTRRE